MSANCASDCVGMTVEIHGLRSQTKLNGKTGQMTGYVNNERWKVMVNDKEYAIKPENLWKIQAAATMVTMPSIPKRQKCVQKRSSVGDGCTGQACQIANAAAGQMASIEPRVWGQHLKRTFYDGWRQRVTLNGCGHELAVCGNDVHKWLKFKVIQVVNTTRAIGQAGWAFSRSNPDDIVACVVWADGQSCASQSTPLFSGSVGWEQWWPCICLPSYMPGQSVLPFYCPALAWASARPWTVHSSRIRLDTTSVINGGSSPPAQEPLWQHVSTVTIEDLIEEADDEDLQSEDSNEEEADDEDMPSEDSNESYVDLGN